MRIQIDRSYRPLEIEVGEEGEEGHVVVDARIDLRDSTISRTSALMVASRDDVNRIFDEDKQLDAADEAGRKRLSCELAKVLRDPICAAIGTESYEDILMALGDGDYPLAAEDANILMTQVFAEVMRVVVEHTGKLKQSKAVHYLADVAADAR